MLLCSEPSSEQSNLTALFRFKDENDDLRGGKRQKENDRPALMGAGYW